MTARKKTADEFAARLAALDPEQLAVEYARAAEQLRLDLTHQVDAATAARDVAGLVLLLVHNVPASQVAALMDVTKQHLLQTVKPRAASVQPAMTPEQARARVRRAVGTIKVLEPLLREARQHRTAGVVRILVDAGGAIANKDIATAAGVGRGTVNSIRRDAEARGLVPATARSERRAGAARVLAAVPDQVLRTEVARRWPEAQIPADAPPPAASACG